MAVKTFVSGEILTAADTNTFLNNGGLVYITGGSLSTATTNVTNCFSSTYRNYRVVIDQISASAAADMYLRFFTTGTTNPAGNNYFFMYRGWTSAGGAGESNAAAAAQAYLGWSSSAAGGAGGVVFDLYAPNVAIQTTATCNSLYLLTGAYGSRAGGFAWDTNATFTGFQIVSTTASTFSGSYAVYGYRIA